MAQWHNGEVAGCVWNYAEAQKEFDAGADAIRAGDGLRERDLEIIHTRGNVNRYLKLAPGRAS